MTSSSFPLPCFMSVSLTCLILVCMFQGMLAQGNANWEFKNHVKKDNPWLIIQEASARMVFEEPIFQHVINCIADSAATNTNTCVSSLVLNQNSTSLDTFYTEFKRKSMEVCEPRCDQLYRDEMTRIADKCVLELTEQVKRSPPSGGDVNELSRVVREVGNSLIGHLKERACIRNLSNPQMLCMVELIDFTMQNKYLTSTPILFRKSVISSLGGMKSMYNHLDPVKMDTLGTKSFCTSCHLQFLQNAETYFANRLYPLLPSISSNSHSKAMVQYTKLIEQTNQLCGANALVSKLKETALTKGYATGGSQADLAFMSRLIVNSAPSAIIRGSFTKILLVAFSVACALV